MHKKEQLLLRPKIDVVFHALFRTANNTLLEAMLSDILETKVKIIENLDRHLDIKSASEKSFKNSLSSSKEVILTVFMPFFFASSSSFTTSPSMAFFLNTS